MHRPLCSSLYAALIICNHLQVIISTQIPEVKETQQLSGDDKAHPSASKETVKISEDKTNAKRGWKDNTMQVWGKRSNKLQEILESRNPLQSDNPSEYQNIDTVKRKWGQNNMPVWGKRNSDGISTADIQQVSDTDSLEKEKRKWGSNSMTVWGKRSGARDESLSEYNTRKWGSNSMTVWGKRSEDPLQFSSPAFLKAKRKWGDNTMSVWGKRSASDSDVISLNFDVEPSRHGSDNTESAVKRKWSDNTMQVWGKRSSDESTDAQRHHSVSKRSVSGYNGGDYDDISESDFWRAAAAEGPSNSWPKRSWESNTMRVWGKRSQPYRTRPLAVELDDNWRHTDSQIPAWYSYRLAGYREPQRRAWSSDNELRVWG